VLLVSANNTELNQRTEGIFCELVCFGVSALGAAAFLVDFAGFAAFVEVAVFVFVVFCAINLY